MIKSIKNAISYVASIIWYLKINVIWLTLLLGEMENWFFFCSDLVSLIQMSVALKLCSAGTRLMPLELIPSVELCRTMHFWYIQKQRFSETKLYHYGPPVLHLGIPTEQMQIPVNWMSIWSDLDIDGRKVSLHKSFTQRSVARTATLK